MPKSIPPIEITDVHDPAEMRQKYRRIRRSISEIRRAEAAEALTDRLTRSDRYRSCEVLLTFLSCGTEISTDSLVKKALADQKQVYCPRVMGKEMVFIRITDLDHLQISSMGIREPEISEAMYRSELFTSSDVLLLAPGLAYGPDCNGRFLRLGYGGGYYDRFLAAQSKKPYCIGIGFREQYTTELKAMPWDQPLDELLLV